MRLSFALAIPVLALAADPDGSALVTACEGNAIEGRLSDGHFGLEYANFTRDEIRQALAAGQPV